MTAVLSTTVDRRRWLMGTGASLAVAASLLANIPMDDPAKLPGVALGSAFILALERSAAMLGALLLVAVILDRAWQGQLPSEISGRGIKYAEAEKTDVQLAALADTVETLTDRTASLETDLEALASELYRDAGNAE